MNKEQHILQNKYFSVCYTQNNFYHESPLMHASENSLRILMVGDVVGKCGRQALKNLLPKLKKSFGIDFITINAENMAGGFGITEKTYLEMNAYGIDVFTMGNHWKDKPEIHTLREKYKNIVLPQNLLEVPSVENIPSFFCESKNKTIHVLNLMGTFAMKAQYGSPYKFLQDNKEILTKKIKENGDIVIADIHAEGCSEKQAMAWFYDGICAAMIGTHTHTPTSDERLLTNGTAFITDVGMTGSYESVTGMNKERVIQRNILPEQKCALEVADKEPWFCGFLIDVDLNTSLAKSCTRLQCRFQENFSEENWFVSNCSKYFK